jgi:hypothetical protein
MCAMSYDSVPHSGQVGLACAYALINQATCRQIVLHDIAPKMDRLEAEVADLLHGMAEAGVHRYRLCNVPWERPALQLLSCN